MTDNLHTQNMKTGKKIIKLIMPFKTYEDELRDKYVNNATELDANLKTRMCKSIEGGFHCSHGEKCRFAHSLEELVTRNCIFNDNCRFVKFRKGKLVNNESSNICMNKHPHENQDDFMERTGLVKYKTISAKQEVAVKSFACDRQTNYSWAAAIKSSRAPSQDTFVFSTPPVPIGGFGCDYTPSLTPPVSIGGFTCAATPSLTPPVPIGGFGCDYTPSLTPPVPIGGFTCAATPSLTPPVPIGGFTCAATPSLTPPVPIGGFTCAATTSGSSVSAPSSYFGCAPIATDKEIVIRVPKEFAMQALELALNTGNRCIRVEVFE
jgi:hypothetical protein